MEELLITDETCSYSKEIGGKNVFFINWKRQLLKSFESKVKSNQNKKKQEVHIKIQPQVEINCKARIAKIPNKTVEFECDQCTAKFARLGKYNTHKRRVHIKPH